MENSHESWSNLQEFLISLQHSAQPRRATAMYLLLFEKGPGLRDVCYVVFLEQRLSFGVLQPEKRHGSIVDVGRVEPMEVPVHSAIAQVADAVKHQRGTALQRRGREVRALRRGIRSSSGGGSAASERGCTNGRSLPGFLEQIAPIFSHGCGWIAMTHYAERCPNFVLTLRSAFWCWC